MQRRAIDAAPEVSAAKAYGNMGKPVAGVSNTRLQVKRNYSTRARP